MPRASRYHIPGQVWHITHRCHRAEFLLKFARDRKRWISWLFEARKRYGLCVLDYMVTSNHVHLLVADDESGAISKSLQLVAGRTAQAFNRRKGRAGAFWEDRYHATAVESGEHLMRCLVYIDLNMVRAGVVDHPSQWPHGGYHEIRNPPRRYRVIDLGELAELCGARSAEHLRSSHAEWIERELRHGGGRRQPPWSEAVAVGSERFVERIRGEPDVRGRGRGVSREEGVYTLREPGAPYSARFDPDRGDPGPENES